MENATKAMLMAAGTLIGVMILSLGVALYSELQSYVESSQEIIEFNEQRAFNTQFTNYENRGNLTIQDIITAANLAYESNINNSATPDERGNPASLYVAVYLNGSPIEHIINEKSVQMLKDNLQIRKNI